MKDWMRKIEKFLWKHFASDWRRANHDLRSTDRLYSRLIADAEKSKNRTEANDLYGEWQSVREPEAHAVERLRTIYWLNTANRNRIPTPEVDDSKYWENDPFTGAHHLTTAGTDLIEERLYEKRKRRWEFRFMLIGSLTGLIGASTGFLALFAHWYSRY